MSGEDDTGAAIREAFEQCESCGTFVVALPQHRCRTDAADARPDRSERSARANADDGIQWIPFSRDRTRCGCEKYTDASDLVETTLGDAKRRGRSPCGSCRHLRRLADDATEE